MGGAWAVHHGMCCCSGSGSYVHTHERRRAGRRDDDWTLVNGTARNGSAHLHIFHIYSTSWQKRCRGGSGARGVRCRERAIVYAKLRSTVNSTNARLRTPRDGDRDRHTRQTHPTDGVNIDHDRMRDRSAGVPATRINTPRRILLIGIWISARRFEEDWPLLARHTHAGRGARNE